MNPETNISVATLHAIYRDPWAIVPTWHASLHDALAALAKSQLQGALETVEPIVSVIEDGIAEIRVQGTMMRGVSPIIRSIVGIADIDEITAAVSSAESRADVKGVLLSINSPGGTVAGTPEAADAVHRLAKRKPVVAFTDSVMASGAYWLGSQARGVVASRSATVGSIGVMMAFPDSSKLHENVGLRIEVLTNDGAIFKGAGTPGTSLSADQRANIEERLNAMFRDFRDGVTRSRRGVSAESMRGQTFYGWTTRGTGLVDVIGDRSTAISHLHALIGRN